MATTTSSRRLVSINDAAEYLGVNHQTVRRLISAGQLSGYRVGNKPKAPIRVDLNQIDADLLRPIPAAGK